MTKIINDRGITITDQKQILTEIKSFYKNLYSNKDEELENVNLNETLPFETIKKLNDQMKSSLEGHITYTELLTSLKQMKHFRTYKREQVRKTLVSSGLGKLTQVMTVRTRAAVNATLD